ncbi:TetR/AcrR family transcriptional regulator [Edaphocola aurantiacus]|uniref:TetR/AcrR family transcriptional regulator n=1 Tax=Edaphocola aurantiacus TaxID=2601682 RepID=UPI00293D57F8|nr:TetR/AcrR family transcriptional regulator [Edaphocola aurantiacus]
MNKLEYSFQFIYLCPVDKKEQIIIAAMKLLAEHGAQATPMSAIAKAAGTGMGTIYNYFATKEELINAIYLYIKGSEINLVSKSIDEATPLKTRFLFYYTAFINFYLKHPEGFAFMDQFQHSPLILDSTKEQGKAGFIPVFALIEQGQKEGIIKNIDMEAILYFLAGTVTTYVRWMISAGKDKHKQHLEQQLRLVWDAIKE